MTTRDRFDDVVTAWLVASGPADIRAAAVNEAIDRAARLPQHRGLRAWLARRPTAWRQRRLVTVMVLVALALAVAAFAAGTLLERSDPLGGGGWIRVAGAGLELHVLTPDGATDRVFSRGYASCPQLAPDGSAVGYALRFSGFHVTRLADENHRKVGSNDTSNTFGYKEGVWSPDRAFLLFHQHEGEAAAVKVLSVFDEDPTTQTVLSAPADSIVSVAWAADSAHLAVARVGARGALFVDIVDLDGVVQRSVGPFSFSAGMMAMSPDAGRVAYVGGTFPSAELLLIDLATGTRRSLGPAGFTDFFAASPWSADGRWLAVDDGNGNLRIASPAGGASVAGPALAVAPTMDGAAIRWSPTADVVAFRTPSGLGTVRADGSSRGDLWAAQPSSTWDFSWSPDGSRIVVAEDRGPSAGVWVDSLDASGRLTPLHLATLPGSGQHDLCLGWDAQTND
jgi:hypothetical protein